MSQGGSGNSELDQVDHSACVGPYTSNLDHEGVDKSRYVDLVRKEFGGRMSDMWSKARARLGRDPQW